MPPPSPLRRVALWTIADHAHTASPPVSPFSFYLILLWINIFSAFAPLPRTRCRVRAATSRFTRRWRTRQTYRHFRCTAPVRRKEKKRNMALRLSESLSNLTLPSLSLDRRGRRRRLPTGNSQPHPKHLPAGRAGRRAEEDKASWAAMGGRRGRACTCSSHPPHSCWQTRACLLHCCAAVGGAQRPALAPWDTVGAILSWHGLQPCLLPSPSLYTWFLWASPAGGEGHAVLGVPLLCITSPRPRTAEFFSVQHAVRL